MSLLTATGAEVLFSSVCAAPRVAEWSLAFDRESGALCSYVLAGRELILEPLMPCFGRAVTENDLGSKRYKGMKQWLYPHIVKESFSYTDEDGLGKVRVSYIVNEAARVDVLSFQFV